MAVNYRGKRVGHQIAKLMVIWLALGTGAWQSYAWNLTDNNSLIHVDDTKPNGMNSWTVDGVSELYLQSFWFRIGSSSGQTAVYSLPQLSITQTSPNTLTTENANANLDFNIRYTLSGGAAGSKTSKLSETITIANRTSSALDLHFFQYTDFDLGGLYAGDTLQLGRTGSLFTSATQSKNGIIGSETLFTGANHGEADIGGSALYLKIVGSSPATLLDNTALVGPGDAAFAFEWDAPALAAHGVLTIQLEKDILKASVVPEPSLAGFMLLGVAGLVSRPAWRRWQRR
jgi:hypothetical protein